MTIVLIILGIIIFVAIVVIIICLSTLRIELANFHITNYPVKNFSNYTIIFKWYFCNRIPLFSKKVNKKQLEQIIVKKHLPKPDIENIAEYLKGHQDTLRTFKKLEVKLARLNMDITLGIENSILPSFLVAMLASVIAIILPKIALSNNGKDYQYSILPVYNKNMYELNLNCIIYVKMVHIIYIIYILLKKKGDLKDERTSNRGSYDYGYE